MQDFKSTKGATYSELPDRRSCCRRADGLPGIGYLLPRGIEVVSRERERKRSTPAIDVLMP
jgi:hypothetical protein